MSWTDAVMGTYGTPQLTVVDADRVFLIDADGNRYLDLLGGIAVNALGYGHPAVVEAVSNQVAHYVHLSNIFAHPGVIQVAEKLQARLGAGESTRTFFCNSGAEANEAAFKIARATGRTRILAAQHGFHGRTMGSLALTGQPAKRKRFEPCAPGVEYYPYGDSDYLRKLVEINASDVAAIFLEPIQGETGVIPAPQGFLTQVRDICDEYGILMVVDEVQTGMGRTGTFFAHQIENVIPDVVTMAKGLASGLPVGAALATGKAAELLHAGDHGSTFGGNPVSMAAANVVLDIIDDAFMKDVTVKGHKLAEGLLQLEQVTNVRGRGLMLGVVLNEGLDARQAVHVGYEQKVILNAPSSSVLRLTPPLVLTDDDVELAINRISATLTALEENHA